MQTAMEMLTSHPSVAPAVRPDTVSDREAGVSMVELLTGMTIAVLLIGGAMMGVVQHQSQRRMHGEKILAMSACRNVLETLRSVEIADLPGYNGTGFAIPGQNGQNVGLTPVDGDADGLPGEITVTAHSRSQLNNPLYVVTTLVRWRGVTSGGHFSMCTLMGERR